MEELNLSKTQRAIVDDVADELDRVGLEDAVEIGRGGFGVVYRCVQAGLDRTVAVKVLTDDLEKERDRFFREQRAMGRLTGHPNIVGVLQVGEISGGRPYLVMQYHRQGSLDERIRRDGPLHVADVLHLGVLLAGALETAHRAEIVHRDVKPANILFTDYGQPALTDFGIAHISGGFETAAGAITVSPAFAPPEVLSGAAPTAASYVYELGATLFCALTGHAAFERRKGEKVVAQFLRISTQPVPDLREQDIPESVCAVIEEAMARDPAERPTAVVFGEHLQLVQGELGFPVDPMTLQPGSQQEDHAVAPAAMLRSEPGQSATGSLPLELTSFVGRSTQLSRVENLLSVSRLVTLTGIGGVGKTRLALQAAYKLRQTFPDGARLVEFGELKDTAVLVDVVSAAVGVHNSAARAPLEVLVEYLSTRKLLLVLDNCEQIVAAVARLVGSLLRACPRLSILATSREALGIGGESVVPLAPLAFPDPASELKLPLLTEYDAVRLFVERASEVVPDFELTDANWPCVVQICARLEGVPLAIELAAARLRTMSTAQVLQRLDDRYALLTHGDRGGPVRQQTLQWCIDWSYSLCTPGEQELWARLSVFAGCFELDAVESLYSDDPAASDLLDALSGLVDKSILVRDSSSDAVRFQMLETLQDYGRRALEKSGEHLEMGRRCRDWYERLVSDAMTDWVSPRQLEWISRLRRELPNLRRAMEFGVHEADGGGLRIAAALYPFWLASGRLGEGHMWVDRMLAQSADAPSSDRAKGFYAASSLAACQGDLEAATRTTAELCALAGQATDQMTAVLAAVADGLTAFMRNDPARAVARLSGAVEALGASGDLFWQIDALLWLGYSYDLQGDHRSAFACLERVITVTESRGGLVFRSWALWNMGVDFWLEGEFDRAAQSLIQGLHLTRVTGDPFVTAIILEALAWIAGDRRAAHRATVLLGAAEALARVVGRSAVLFANLLAYHKECKRCAREVLGVQEFETARQVGGSMSLEAAIDFALSE